MTGNDNWRLKEYSRKGSPERWFFRKNLAPAVRPRHPDYGFIAYLTFAYTPRDASGLPSVEDEATLYKIEDEELDSLEVDGLAVHVAAAMKNGIKDLLFYTRNAEEFSHPGRDIQDSIPAIQHRLRSLSRSKVDTLRRIPVSNDLLPRLRRSNVL